MSVAKPTLPQSLLSLNTVNVSSAGARGPMTQRIIIKGKEAEDVENNCKAFKDGKFPNSRRVKKYGAKDKRHSEKRSTPSLDHVVAVADGYQLSRWV